MTLRQSNLVLKIQVLWKNRQIGRAGGSEEQADREEQASQKPEEEEILEEWKD
ncbi:MAG: hypothetical protein ACLRMZ_26665 [Blautia marasmi]